MGLGGSSGTRKRSGVHPCPIRGTGVSRGTVRRTTQRPLLADRGTLRMWDDTQQDHQVSPRLSNPRAFIRQNCAPLTKQSLHVNGAYWMKSNRFDVFPLAVLVAALLACGVSVPPKVTIPNAPMPKAVPMALAVTVGKGDAPRGYQQLRTITVSHGRGCGELGELGNFEGAYRKLRNYAVRLSADYVQIIAVTEPYLDIDCRHNEYKITAVAYRRPKNSEEDGTLNKPAATPPQSDGVARACFPGATQHCLGPGACRGAQACNKDGSAFSDCDCGTEPAATP